MDKHEPGPWTYASVVDGEGARKFVIQPVLAYVHVDDPERDEANIRLMTAAPELLEALEECAHSLSFQTSGSSGHNAFVKSCTAIAKAKGK